MSQRDCKDESQTAELTDLTPTTEDAEETTAGTHTFNAYGNTYRGGVNVAAGDIN